jgi:hypothetical protein
MNNTSELPNDHSLGQEDTKGVKPKNKTTYISVCKNIILSNLKHSRNDPAIRISVGKYDKHPRKAHELTITSPSTVRVVCDMENPLPWGARVWIEVNE